MIEFIFELASRKFKVEVLLYKNNSTSPVLDKIKSCSIKAVCLRADMLVNSFQLQIGINKALKNYVNQRMKTKTVENEVIYCINPNTSINLGFKNFGFNEECQYFLVLSIQEEGNENLDCDKFRETFDNIFETLPLKFDNLDIEIGKLTNIKKIKKVYDLENLELNDNRISELVISSMALKWCS